MIAVVCAMQEERDALLKMMDNVVKSQGKTLLYRGKILDNEYYQGHLEGKEIVLCRCGIGQVYAAMSALLLIEKFKPELLINLGCAGSLNENVHVGDVVIANRVGQWRIDVPGWERNIESLTCSFPCDEKVTVLFPLIDMDLKIHSGSIVSADEFIYKNEQVKEIKEHFPEALCGEMEGYAIAAAAYALNVPCTIIRSISDETLISGDYNSFYFNLEDVCNKAALLCKEIIKRYK